MAKTPKKNTKPKPRKQPPPPEPVPSNPPPAGFPTLPTGVGGLYGLDAAGNLVVYAFPLSERYLKAGPPDLPPKWTNT
jgi:hypothetical protein